MNIQRFGDPPHGAQMPEAVQKKIMQIAHEAPASIKLMGNDQLNFMGRPFSAGNNFSLVIHPGSDEQADTFFNLLSASSTITVPMRKAPLGDYLGMFTDKFGIKWMIKHQPK